MKATKAGTGRMSKVAGGAKNKGKAQQAKSPRKMKGKKLNPLFAELGPVVEEKAKRAESPEIQFADEEEVEALD